MDILSKSQVEDEGPAAAAVKAETEASVSFQARRIQTTVTINTASAASPHWTPRDGLDTTQESPDPCPPTTETNKEAEDATWVWGFHILLSVPPGLSAIIPPNTQTPSQKDKKEDAVA